MASTQGLGDLKPVYLIYGTEELLLERAVRRLKQRVGEVADLDFNFQVFDAESAEADEIVNASNTMPFMSERRLVIVRHVEKMQAKGLDVLAAYAAAPSETTCLVLVAGKVDKRWRLYKTVTAAGGASEYAAPRRNEYAPRVIELFREKGKSIGLDAAEVLVRAVGRDLQRLSVEVDKVAASTGDAKTLSAEDVERVMSVTAPTSMFDFLDAMGERDVRTAMRLLSDLLGQGEELLGVHAMSLWHVRRLLSVHALRDRGASSAEMCKAIGAGDWQVRKLAGQAQRFRAGELEAAIRAAAGSEARMKTSQGDPRLVFERWVVSVCSRS